MNHFILTTLFLTLLASTVRADEPREEKPRFKGVELYSWKDDTGKFTFVFVDGTNRIRSADEIKAAPNQHKSVMSLQSAIEKLAPKETVSWYHTMMPKKSFQYPAKESIDVIKKTAASAGVKLSVPELKE